MPVTANVPKDLLKQLMQIFPNQLSYAFAYGSGVFNQGSAANKDETDAKEVAKKNMIDMILVTDDSLDFHHKNLIKNPSHYSFLRALGPKWLTTIQENFGAKVYYNTLIPVDNYLIKYGVISTKDLITDCMDWQTLYISGRLHKPVAVLKEPVSNDLSKALKTNTENALHSALLMLSQSFTEEELYMQIAGISYLGDFRMTFGEDRDKVRKIVRPQIHNFRRLYQPLMTSKSMSQLVSWNPTARVYNQDCSPNALFYHLNFLPKSVEDRIANVWNSGGHFTDMDDLLRSLSHDIECRTLVRTVISDIVNKYSISQSFKGIFSAGLFKSVRYSSEKVSKMFRSFK